MCVIDTCDLTKRFGRIEVLHGVTMRVESGRLFGFLGPNGAGKTTTIRILLGLLRSSGGAARVFGRDPWRDGVTIRSEVGYLPGEMRLYDNMTGRANLDLFARARRRDCTAEIHRLQARFDLDLDKTVRDYSSGMRQKLGVIQAMMHHPRLLILDEPTNTLDPLVRQMLYEELRAVATDGRTVLFSSHTLSEVEMLCDEVAILREGVVVEQGRVESLRKHALRRVEIVLANPDTDINHAPAALKAIKRSGAALSATWSGPPDELLRWLATVPLRDVTIARPDLADLFLTYYNGREPATQAEQP